MTGSLQLSGGEGLMSAQHYCAISPCRVKPADQADLIRDLAPNLKPVCSKSTGHSLRKQVFLEAR